MLFHCDVLGVPPLWLEGMIGNACKLGSDYSSSGIAMSHIPSSCYQRGNDSNTKRCITRNSTPSHASRVFHLRQQANNSRIDAYRGKFVVREQEASFLVSGFERTGPSPTTLPRATSISLPPPLTKSFPIATPLFQKHLKMDENSGTQESLARPARDVQTVDPVAEPSGRPRIPPVSRCVAAPLPQD